MPRRTATPATPAPPAPLPPPPRDLAALAESDPQWAANLHTLRRNWKWANFSQFFYTFAPLLNMPDVFLSDVEDDLARGTNIYLPRIMHRLLYTLSQDRKLSIDNWQTALRRQYLRRDPAANPIGPEPKIPSRESSIAPSEEEQEEAKGDVTMDESKPDDGAPSSEKDSTVPAEDVQSRSSSEPKPEPTEDGKIPTTDKEDEPFKVEEEQEEEESRDWLDLPMLDKLDSLYLLTEWQFQNPHRVRQLMKDDDDAANWRIEPIGYDAKTNAYWLIGPDRLWIQRVPPKPPRNRTLKRKRPSAPPKKPVRKAPETSSDDEDDEPVAPSKRTRLQSNSRSTRSQPKGKTNARSARASRRAAQSSDELISPGKSTRAAKVQANKKLDLQAKELAEFQRQAAALARAQTSPRSPRKARGAATSPSKRAMGTRVSARLRGSARGGGAGGEDDSDDEWQQVPEEWLQEEAMPERRTRTRTRSKGKARADPEEDEPEDELEADEEDQTDAYEQHADADEEQADEEDADADKGGEDDVAVAGDAANVDNLLQKAGLESGSVSDLTDLSDAEEAEDDDSAEEDDDHVDSPPAKRQRGGGRRARGGRRKSTASRRTSTRVRRGRMAAEAPSSSPAKQSSSPSKAKAQSKSKLQSSKSKSKSEANADAEQDPDREPEDDQEEEPPAPPLPEDFVEWEAIAVTLSEWEHVADPFEKAAHYLEKALYKMLTQNIVPLVTADLREAEKRRRMEEAIVHRKRSSRIALKESEKEEQRMAAKKKAEEEEKNARAKRQEARQKKEEEERAKREKAREQRAKEREEREARARAKAERAEREEAEAEAARSTATPVNGTQKSSSLQPSRMVTPNGVRTPDWVLDCEVCRRQGVNVDDGMAMVSCGSCNRWQHIKCHDIADQRAGKPRRDWDKQQFFCMRCRQRAANGSAYGAQGYSVHQQQQPYGWQQRSGPIHLHKPGVDPYGQTSDMRYSHTQTHRSPVLENGGGMGYSQQQQYLQNNVGAASYSRSSYPNSGLSFHHYQPDQRGLSSRAMPTTPQGSGSWSSNGGYGGTPDPLTGRMSSSSQYASQYNGAGMYGSGRMSTGYSNHATSPIPQYNDRGASISSSRWPSSQSNGYHSSAVQEAAQSLAFMHDGASNGGSRYGNSSWPAQSSSYGQIPTSSSHSHTSYAPPPPGIDPLTGQPFPRVEQHVGHGLTHSSSSGSFNFPS